MIWLFFTLPFWLIKNKHLTFKNQNYLVQFWVLQYWVIVNVKDRRNIIIKTYQRKNQLTLMRVWKRPKTSHVIFVDIPLNKTSIFLTTFVGKSKMQRPPTTTNQAQQVWAGYYNIPGMKNVSLQLTVAFRFSLSCLIRHNVEHDSSAPVI